MSQTGKDDVVSAANWLFSGLLASSKEYLLKAKEPQRRGATEITHTHLVRTSQSLERVSCLMEDASFVFPRLTLKESARLHLLESLEFIDYDTNSDAELKSLRNKAWGVE
ncbi:MAG: hypothetical protein WAV41_04155 [Microgenomates group bacterium]